MNSLFIFNEYLYSICSQTQCTFIVIITEIKPLQDYNTQYYCFIDREIHLQKHKYKHTSPKPLQQNTMVYQSCPLKLQNAIN